MKRKAFVRCLAVAALVHVVVILFNYHWIVTAFGRHTGTTTVVVGSSKKFKADRVPCVLEPSTTGQKTPKRARPLILLGTEYWGRTRYWGNSWTSAPNNDSVHNSSVHFYLRSCPSVCRFTFNWRKFHRTADLVIVPTFYFQQEASGRDLNQSTILLWQAEVKEQLWLGVTRESPLKQQRRGEKVDGVFHWIANYRRDSDVIFSYGSSRKLNKPAFTMHSAAATAGNVTARKKKLAAWLVSNCKPQSGRDLAVKTLQKFIPVEVYGKCGGRKCPNERDCRKYLAQNYKFYLAFENSLCIDYVTEKLYDNLKLDILPVTYSWINDTSVIPPYSYINALDFRSIRDLANYMIYLDQNEDEYQKYFTWKNEYEILPNTGLCLACQKLLDHLRWAVKSEGKKPIRRHESMLGWMNSFPQDGSARPELRVGDNAIRSNQTCITDPMKNQVLKEWILGVK